MYYKSIKIVRDFILVVGLLFLNTGILYSEIDFMLMPIVFAGKVLPDSCLKDKPYKNPELSDIRSFVPNYDIPYETDLFSKKKIENEIYRKAYLYIVSNNPALIKYRISKDMPRGPEISEIKVNPLKNLFAVEMNPDFLSKGTPERFHYRKNWIITGNHLLQFSQNYISDNWYKGGVGSLNILSNQNVKFDYKKNKMQFSSFFEWNVNFYTVPNDALRKTRIGTDILRSYSNFGLKTFSKQWFYSTNVELKTQMLNNYGEDTQIKTSSFLAPFYANVGVLGIRYELDKEFAKNKYKLLKFSAELSPLSVKYIYIRDSEVSPMRHGIPQDKNSVLYLGSLVNATIDFKISKSTSFKSRLKYFTNYEKMEVESENELNFSINRYFSTRIYLYLRYDNGENIPRDPTLGYLQVNELLSFGFKYTW